MPQVYVVEDDEAVRRSLCLTLDIFGYDVNDFGNGEEFLNALGEPQLEPAALLLDVGLPGLDGLAVQHQLNTEGWRPPVVMISGQAEISMAVRAMRKRGCVHSRWRCRLPMRMQDELQRSTLRN